LHVQSTRVQDEEEWDSEEETFIHNYFVQTIYESAMSYYDEIIESTNYLKDRIGELPEVAIVLGSGLGPLADDVQDPIHIPYEEIPNFPPATVKGHSGALISGKLHGKRVIAQSGRYHYYEGYNMKEVTLPIRVFKALDAKVMLMASAVGGIHEDYEAGDITVVNDHINLHSENPLHGPNDPRLGVRFPDMSEAYSQRLISKCHEIATQLNIKLHNSVYGGLPGPNLETKAEYNYLHTIGATVVGMSTVPEVIVANHAGLESCVLTAVTNKCFPISAIKEVSHQEVIDVATTCSKKISEIFKELLKNI